MKCKNLGPKRTCSLGLFEGKPSARNCARCSKYEPGEPEDGWYEGQGTDIPQRGLGDTVAKVTSALGFKPCGGCKKRQEALNRMFSYKQPGKKKGCGCGKKDTHGSHNVTNTPDDS